MSTLATSTSGNFVELQHLRLEDARALLSRDASLAPSESNVSATDYLQSVIDGLCALSSKDPLTGLSNRRQFNTILEKTIDSVARTGDPALLLMLDIDHFKNVNDTYGHQAGDQVLQAMASVLAKCLRPMDTVARYGGEEFAAILPNCHAYFGIAVAERIRKSVEALSIPIFSGGEISVTVSIGGAYAPEWVRSTAALWTERADLQLYRSKTEGRNCVRLDQQQEIFVSAEEKNMLFGHLSLGDPAWIESVANDAPGTNASSASQRVN